MIIEVAGMLQLKEAVAERVALNRPIIIP